MGTVTVWRWGNLAKAVGDLEPCKRLLYGFRCPDPSRGSKSRSVERHETAGGYSVGGDA